MGESDHCQYPTLTFGKVKFRCSLVPANGDISACLDNCNKQAGCTAVNVVPLRNDPQVVRFGGTPNIPFGRSKFCKQKTYANAPANARVCYGGIAPDRPKSVSDNIR